MRNVRVTEPIARPARHEVIKLLTLALVGTIAVAGAVLMLNWRVDHDIVTVIDPAAQSRTAPLFGLDFPGYHLHQGPGHDGQAVYAIARSPMHLQDVAHWVDRPQYRMQRITLPVLGWMLHPQGGGRGLVVALWFWAAIGVALTGFGGALLARGLGVSADAAARLALLLPLLPAAWATLDLTVADELALGLVLLAMALDLFGARRSAIVLAVLGVLAKEVVLLVLLGWVVLRGARALVRLFVIPGVAVGVWWLFLHLTISGGSNHYQEFRPVLGLVDAIDTWRGGYGRFGALVALIAIVLGVVVLARRGIRSPLAPAIALQLGLLCVLSADVFYGDWNTTRTISPLLVLSIIALTVPAHSPDLAQLPLELVDLVA
jgi:hypothetical protein